ncbi:MAG TPA: hypothetical protein VGN20_06505 [Mucilaginibacter sp.]|jgi:hypothetical protein
MFVLDMSKYTKPKFEEKDLGPNPFLNSLIVPVNKVESADRFKQDGSEWYKSGYDYDAAEYCKVFSNAKNRQMMVTLSPRAKDLFLWIIYEAEKSKDHLWLNKDRYMDESGVKALNTYRMALKELIVRGLIVKTVVSGVIFLNPHFFYNGNRIKSFPDNVKVR